MRYQQVLRYVVAVVRSGSIRRAADKLNITPSALNRRIQDLEHELRSPLFERWAKGMRLTSAGELFVQYARTQLADGLRLQSAIEDLRGLRRGSVQIVCSQAVVAEYLPRKITEFQQVHPTISFNVAISDHDLAMTALEQFDAEIALVYKPSPRPAVRIIATLRQRIMAVMRPGHPLAERTTIRLSDLATYPLALPDRRYGVRQIIDDVSAKRNLRFNVAIESDSFEMLRGVASRSDTVSLQIEIGAPDIFGNTLGRPIDRRDAAFGEVALCQLRGRSLPVAAALFAEHIANDFANAELQAARGEAVP